MNEEQDATSEELRARNFDLYSESALDFALGESEKSLCETLVVFRKTNETSFIILSLYLAIAGYITTKIIDSDRFDYITLPVSIIIVGVIIALYFIWHNIGTGLMHEIGEFPDVFIREVNETIEPEKQLKKFKVSKLTNNQDYILHNNKENKKRNSNIKFSIEVLMSAFFIAGLIIIAETILHVYL